MDHLVEGSHDQCDIREQGVGLKREGMRKIMTNLMLMEGLKNSDLRTLDLENLSDIGAILDRGLHQGLLRNVFR